MKIKAIILDFNHILGEYNRAHPKRSFLYPEAHQFIKEVRGYGCPVYVYTSGTERKYGAALKGLLGDKVDDILFCLPMKPYKSPKYVFHLKGYKNEEQLIIDDDKWKVKGFNNCIITDSKWRYHDIIERIDEYISCSYKDKVVQTELTFQDIKSLCF